MDFLLIHEYPDFKQIIINSDVIFANLLGMVLFFFFFFGKKEGRGIDSTLQLKILTPCLWLPFAVYIK